MPSEHDSNIDVDDQDFIIDDPSIVVIRIDGLKVFIRRQELSDSICGAGLKVRKAASAIRS